MPISQVLEASGHASDVPNQILASLVIPAQSIALQQDLLELVYLYIVERVVKLFQAQHEGDLRPVRL